MDFDKNKIHSKNYQGIFDNTVNIKKFVKHQDHLYIFFENSSIREKDSICTANKIYKSSLQTPSVNANLEFNDISIVCIDKDLNKKWEKIIIKKTKLELIHSYNQGSFFTNIHENSIDIFYSIPNKKQISSTLIKNSLNIQNQTLTTEKLPNPQKLVYENAFYLPIQNGIIIVGRDVPFGLKTYLLKYSSKK